MKIELILIFQIKLLFSVSNTQHVEWFSDYCKADLCKNKGGEGVHSGCKNGIRHDGKFQSPPCDENTVMLPLSRMDKQNILDNHNEQRNFVACGGLYKQYGFEPGCRIGIMTWDIELEKTAFLHVSYCIADHDQCRSTVKYPYSGQNSALLPYIEKHPLFYYISIIPYIWYIEYRNAKMSMINNFHQQTEVMVDDFFNLINERNNRVGCALAKFFHKRFQRDCIMLTCNYAVENLNGSTVYNSCKVPGSKCIKGTDKKYESLCSWKEKYDVSGVLNHIPYDGSGKESYHCGKPIEFRHFDSKVAESIKLLHKIVYPNYPMPIEKPKDKPQEPALITQEGEPPSAISDDNVFTNYCKSGLCTKMGGDGAHSGCKNGIYHNGRFQAPPCPADAARILLTDAEKQSILNYHNKHRNFLACGGLYKQHGLGPGCRLGVVTWDEELEKTAYLHTSYCLLDHDKCRSTVKYPFSGQNVGVRAYDNVPDNTSEYINTIIYFWYSEYLNTKMNIIDNFSNITEWVVDHFSTIANEGNNRVGCAFGKYFDNKREKQNVVMLTCNYPTTNIVGAAVYNSCKEPASKCIAGKDKNYKYLCSSKEAYDVSGPLQHIPYDGDGSEEFDCGEKPDKDSADSYEVTEDTLLDAAVIPLTKAAKQSILDYHNEHRNFVACGGLYKQYGLKPGCRHGVMTWDKELEKASFLRTSNCLLDHDKCYAPDKLSFGQNVGLLPFYNQAHSLPYYINAITYFWYVEYLHTKMDIIDSFYNQTNWIVDHFLITVNERNNRVGCTFGKYFDDKKEKKNVVMLTCKYPVTNIERTAVYNSCKVAASKCTTGRDTKYKNLCSSKERYDVNKQLTHIPYDGNGTEVFNCEKKPEFHHFAEEGGNDIKDLHKTKYPDDPIPVDDTASDVFTDYCKPGLCNGTGDASEHSGCKGGVLHDGKFQFPPCPKDAERIPLSDAEKQSILDYHNEHRNFVACGGLYKQYHLGPGCRHGVMTWDEKLEKTAFLHTSNCLPDPDKCRSTIKYPFSGQNVGLLPSDNDTAIHNTSYYINTITYFWYVEYLHTKMDMIDKFYNQSKWVVDHFLNTVNERNNRVGCSLGKYFDEKTEKKNVVMLTCNYPTTNIEGTAIYNSCKEPASKCTTGTDKKYKYLCSSKEPYDVSGLLMHTPYDGDGTEVFDCGKEPEFHHFDEEGGDDIKELHKIKYPDNPTPGETPSDYCKSGSCNGTGDANEQSGCKGVFLYDGKFQFPPCPKDTELIPLTESERQSILDYHNEHRNFVACGGLFKQYRLGPGCRHGVVTWDEELEETALLHTSNCLTDPDKCRSTVKYPFFGQNVGLLPSDNDTSIHNTSYYINTITYFWYVEYLHTKMDMIDKFYNQSKWVVDHFLNTVNERNNRVGCTLGKYFDDNIEKKNVTMLTCSYPTSNIEATAIYNSCKKPASRCTTGTDKKYKYLCSSKEPYDVSGLLMHIPYDGDGTEVFDCGKEPEFHHFGEEGGDDIKKLHKIKYPDNPIPTETPSAKSDADVFTDYCKPGLCKGTGDPSEHSGCKGGVLHDGKFQFPPCPKDAERIPLTDAEKQSILDYHNEHRNFVACGGLYKQYRLGPGCRHGAMTWDEELEKTAFLHTSNCLPDPDKCRSTVKYPFAGQNVGLLPPDNDTAVHNTSYYINTITYFWYVEYLHTKMDMIDKFYNQSKWVVDHFLNTVNERNNRVGCSLGKYFDEKTEKKNVVMLTCNYPTTNIEGTAIYNSCKKPASRCTTGTDKKYKYLCSSKEPYDVSGLLMHTPYDGDGTEVFDCGKEPEFHHFDEEGGDDIKKLHKIKYPDNPIPGETPSAKSDADIFTDYCKPGLCNGTGDASEHSGCKGGVLHDGKFQFPPCPKDAERIPLTDAEKQSILDFHNEHRNFVACGGLYKQYRLGPGCRHGVMTWDEELEKTAFLHTSNCLRDPDKCRSTVKYPFSGQNVGLLPPDNDTAVHNTSYYINTITYFWYVEYIHTKMDMIDKFYNQSKWVVDHFLNTVNERNNRVGCSLGKYFDEKTEKKNIVMLTCNYPTTNIEGTAIYNSCKEPASKCTTGTDKKYKYLCSSKEPYDVSGLLMHTPYDGDGTEVFDCGKEPEFHHFDEEGGDDIKKLHKIKYPDNPIPGETPSAKSDADVFTDYCKPGLCNGTGDANEHSGCKGGVLHDGKFQFPPCPKDAERIPLTDAEKQSILDYHNEHRNFVACGGLYKQYRLGPGCRHGVMTWDEELENTAFLHTSNCLPDPDKCRSTVKYPFSGQNVGLLPPDNDTAVHNTSYYINTITYFWYVEYIHTKMDMIDKFYNQSKWVVDHFLNTVNERNNRVGCSLGKYFDEKTEKKNVVMLTCNYPTTNIEGTAIYNSCKKPASRCTTGTDKKYKYLCSSKEPYDVSGLLMHTPYDGDGTEVFDCGKEPEFHHFDEEGGDDIKKLHKIKYPDNPIPGETPSAKSDADIFTDYCKPGLCNGTGDASEHSGCKGGVLHDGKFQFPPCPKDAERIPLTDAEKQSILDFHNEHRNFVACGGLYKQYRLGPGCRHGVMTWDEELEKTAFLHTSNCLRDPDKCRSTVKYPFSGQNVGLLPPDNDTAVHNTSYYINTITYFWYVEYIHTKMDMIDKFYNQSKWVVDHFLNTVNERNNRVGCSLGKYFDEKTEKKNIVMLTCNYPTTNIEGTAIYNSCKEPASKCTTGTDKKYKYLCSSKEPYDVSGLLMHTPYDGDGTEVFDCGKEPEFHHFDEEGGDDIKKLHKIKYPDNPIPGETPSAKSDADVFTDYCKPGLCNGTGDANEHSGCKGGVLHDGKFQFPACPKDAERIPLTDAEKQSILDYHNEHRNFVACGGLYKQYRLGPGCRHGVMTWDEELENTAFLHTSNCLPDPDKCRSTVKYPFSGQNVGLLPPDNDTAVHNTSYYINTITYFWYVEYIHTKMDMIDKFYNQSKWVVDHFLNTVNERNNRVGCSLGKYFDEKTEKKNVVMLTCNYPTTNIEGTAIYNSCKEPASKCTTGTDKKYKYLCSSKEPYDVSGLLMHIPYNGDGTEVFDCGKEPEFHHFDEEGGDDIKKLHKIKYPDNPIPTETPSAKSNADVFTDYCKPGLCNGTGDPNEHSGCKGGVLHDGKFQFPPCPKDAERIPLTDAEKQSILDYHNEHRNFVACGGLYKQYRLRPGCRHGVMTWDEELERTAFLHTSNCLPDPDKCRSTVKYPFSGQNVGLLPPDNDTAIHNTSYYINTITYFWYGEYIHTKMDMIDKFYNQSKWVVDHFLNTVNERNNRVGCSLGKYFDEKTEKKNVVMLTCNYPTTNIEGTAIYNSCKKPASRCTTGTDKKYKYLCSSKEPYDVSGLLMHIPYDGNGTEVFDCGKEPEFHHFDEEGGDDIKKLHKIKYPDNPIPGETPSAKSDADVLTDYCKPGLCNGTGDASEHSGCKGGVLHDGKFQFPPCPKDAERIPLTDAEKQSILDYHNEHRNFVACGGLYKQYRLGPGCRHGVMTWDEELEKTAFLHTSNCLRDPDKCRSTVKYPFSGQNVGLLPPDNDTAVHNTSYYINTITYFWYVEYIHTKMDMIDKFYNQSKWVVDHFLNTVNERNNRVGCSLGKYFDEKTEKKNIVMLTCNYPTTNIEGTAIYNSCKEPASKCTTGTDKKYKYLCSSKEPYDVSGLLMHIPYDGNGTEVFDCGKEPEFHHFDEEGGDDIKKLHKIKYPDNPVPTETPSAKSDADVFTDYCKPGLCNGTGDASEHSGCKGGVLHDGKFQFPPCPKDAERIPLTGAEKQSILDYHNEHRNFVACGGLFKQYRLGPGCRHGVMTWDEELEITAFLHTSNCLRDPDKCRSTVKYPFSGQNVGLLPSDNDTSIYNTSYYINTITYFWYVEYLHTEMDMIDKFYNQSKWVVDHFLNTVNERNNRVGCSLGKYFDEKTEKKSVVMLTCNYPTTNIEGTAIYNSCKEPASKCTTGTDKKYKYLCSSKEPYDVSGLLTHIPYDGDGTEVFDCGKEPEFHHFDEEGGDDIKKLHKIKYPDNRSPTETPSAAAKPSEDIFTDYCKPGLCSFSGGKNAHSGCRDGDPHNGEFQSPPCPEGAAFIPLTDADKQYILDYHNEHRNFVACGGLYKEYRIEPGCRHGVVTWDEELEKTAYLHTSYCLSDPDECRNTVKYPISGQNVGVSAFVNSPRNTSYYINVLTYYWYVEYLNTKMHVINSFITQTKWMVEHFLTLVNERNNRVGCSFGRFFDNKKVQNVFMLSCNYPVANIKGSTIYNSCKEPASKCTTGTDQNYKYLCSSKESYDVSGLLPYIPYDGDGTEVFKCDRKGEFNHYDREGGDDIKKLHKIKYPDKPIPIEETKEQTIKKPVVPATIESPEPSKNYTSLIDAAKSGEDIFTDYCKPGLCTYAGGDNEHSGCKDGVPHDGNFQSPPCPKDATRIPLTDADKQFILNFHNDHRNYIACGGLYNNYRLKPGCRHGVVTWDKELEKTAFLHTSYCLKEQDKCRNTVKYPFSGQNVGVLPFDSKSDNTTAYINVAVHVWYFEYQHTSMNMINNFMHQNASIVDHFLMLINERNNRVGCSLGTFFERKSSNNVFMLSCNYPTTNIEGSTIYNSCKKPASKCTTGTDPKYKSLCSSKEPYDVSGPLQYIPYDGDGTEVFHCSKNPQEAKEGAADKVKRISKEDTKEQTSKKSAAAAAKEPSEPSKNYTSLIDAAKSGEDIFTDYCKPGLCTYAGGDNEHSGCKDGVPHDGNFQSPPCPKDATRIPLTDADKQFILNFHNDHRNYIACGGLYNNYRLKPGCRHGVVTWDKELEKTAFLHTSYCLKEQDKCRNTVKYPFSGQNVGVLPFDSKSDNTTAYINVAVHVWYFEYQHTSMNMINNFMHQNASIVDHFLMLINERNNRVGCSLGTFLERKSSNNVFMLSCNYPTTNIEGSTIYNSCKEPSSKCITGTDPKYKYLCSSKEPYDVSGPLQYIPYDGDGTEVFHCSKNPQEAKEGAADKVKRISKEDTKEQTSKKSAAAAAKEPSVFFSPITSKPYEDTFTDYCKPGLCTYNGGENAHSGCRDGDPHNGNFQSPPCPEGAALIPLTDADKQSILDYHNEHRNFVACGGLYNEYGIGPGCRHGVVTWDKELEKTAFLHTSYCLSDPDECRNTVKYPISGQNVGVSAFVNAPRNTSYYINVITYFWYVEYLNTSMHTINTFKRQTKWSFEHFLTLVNERNNRVGCSFGRFFDYRRVQNVVMLSCNYPTANIEGSTVYNSCKNPASKCTTGTDPKYKYLCSLEEPYDVSGLLLHIPYDGTGTEVFKCARKGELYHYDREGGDDIKKLIKIKYPDKSFLKQYPKAQTIKKDRATMAKKGLARTSPDIFTDYCKPGLCTYSGGKNAHSGCKDGVPHNGHFQNPPCPEGAAFIPLTNADRQSILDYHNKQRNFVACGGLYKKHRIEPGCRHALMTWDKELEKTAFLHTSYCLKDHDKCRNTVKYPISGQNIGVQAFVNIPKNTSHYINIITYSWYIEHLETNMNMINSFMSLTAWKAEHFLTLVNERNNRVGCSFGRFFDYVKVQNVVMLSCNYPTANIEGSTVYNSCKKPASKCKTGTDHKYKFLCSSKEKYDVSGLLQYIPYDGDGTERFKCGREVEFYHFDREGGEYLLQKYDKILPDKPILREEHPIHREKKRENSSFAIFSSGYMSYCFISLLVMLYYF